MGRFFPLINPLPLVKPFSLINTLTIGLKTNGEILFYIFNLLFSRTTGVCRPKTNGDFFSYFLTAYRASNSSFGM